MKSKKPIEITTSVIESIICNRCGKKVIVDNTIESITEINKMHSFLLKFIYGSKHDLQAWEFDLCEQCLEKFIEEFKVPVKIMGYSPWGKITDNIYE